MPKNVLFFTSSFFIACLGIAILFCIGFFIPVFEQIAQIITLVFITLVILETVLLFSVRKPITASRDVPQRTSIEHSTSIAVICKNRHFLPARYTLYEELPYQFRKKDFILEAKARRHEKIKIQYRLTPTERGMYTFGNLNFYTRVLIGWVERKNSIPLSQEMKVYPNYLDLKKYDLNTLKTSAFIGIRKNQKLGHSMEFEQIKNYVPGDNIKHINWKATAKRNHLMVNQYTDEKSKEVYCILDTGRNMKSPFDGLALIDYAINSSLVILNNVLNHKDRAGVLSFNKTIEHFLPSEQKPNHIQKILEILYNIKPQFLTSDFSKLYQFLQRKISHRSLFFLFTNFEDYDDLKRQLPYFRALNKKHLLVVIFFKNTELEENIENIHTTRNIFEDVLIEKQITEKKKIVSTLQNYGIQSILTHPHQLTFDLLNKYLEIKAKGML